MLLTVVGPLGCLGFRFAHARTTQSKHSFRCTENSEGEYQVGAKRKPQRATKERSVSRTRQGDASVGAKVVRIPVPPRSHSMEPAVGLERRVSAAGLIYVVASGNALSPEEACLPPCPSTNTHLNLTPCR